MTTTELIELLKKYERGGATGRPRELMFEVDDRIIDTDGIEVTGSGDGLMSELYLSLPSAQPKQRWIPVTEKLPEDEYVLISKKPTKLSGNKWCVIVAIRMADPRSGKVQWRDSGFGVIQDDEVLAWMPRPKPWKEGEA